MSFFGVSGMYYSGESLQQHRIVLAEDSNLFAAMVSKRLKELLDIDVIVCRDYDDLQFSVENASFPATPFPTSTCPVPKTARLCPI
jgi:hypothetical protein